MCETAFVIDSFHGLECAAHRVIYMCAVPVRNGCVRNGPMTWCPAKRSNLLLEKSLSKRMHTGHRTSLGLEQYNCQISASKCPVLEIFKIHTDRQTDRDTFQYIFIYSCIHFSLGLSASVFASVGSRGVGLGRAFLFKAVWTTFPEFTPE